MLNALLTERNISTSVLSKISGVPYATVNDICNEKTKIENCSAATLYKLAKALKISMEDLIAPAIEESRESFELFKSSVCHRLKAQDDIDFIVELLEKDEIRSFYKRKWYPECLYLLALLDYLSRINDIPLCSEYNDIRAMKLQKTIYPSSIIVSAAVSSSAENIKAKARRESIPEFIRFNIVEREVRNVV